MKSAIYNPKAKETSYLSIAELAKPILKGNNTIVKVRGCGICGSDLLKLDRGLVPEGTVLGHELVGEVYEISREMSTKYDLKKGDRIISSHHIPCLECEFCINGKESLCKQFKSTNFYPGAFSEYLELSELHLKYTVHKIPDSLSDEETSFTEPLACCIKAVKKSGLLQHKGPTRVLVIGLGSIGLLIGQLIKLNNLTEIIGCDPIEHKRKLALQNGFDEVASDLGATRLDMAQKVDYIFLSAGANATVDLAVQNIKDGGTIVVFASVADNEKGFSNNDIYYKELNIVASYSPNLVDVKESLDLLINKKINTEGLITHRADLHNLGTVIKSCKGEEGMKVYLDLV